MILDGANAAYEPPDTQCRVEFSKPNIEISISVTIAPKLRSFGRLYSHNFHHFPHHFHHYVPHYSHYFLQQYFFFIFVQ